MKLSQMIDLTSRKKPIDFERSRSKVKVTRGQKVKNFEPRYLKNYWADFLQTKLKSYSSVRATILCMTLPVPTSGKKARQRSKVKYTFLAISRKVFVVETSSKDHCLPLEKTHKNDRHDFFAPTHGFRDIVDFVFSECAMSEVTLIMRKNMRKNTHFDTYFCYN